MICEGVVLTLFVSVAAKPADGIILQSTEPFHTPAACEDTADKLMLDHIDGVRYYGSHYVFRCTPAHLSPMCRGGE